MAKASRVCPYKIYGWTKNKFPVAKQLWDMIGNPIVFIEPFGGNLTLLFARPQKIIHQRQYEVIGELDSNVINFWNCVVVNPGRVWEYADLPNTDNEFTRIQNWLISTSDEFECKMNDVDYMDFARAGRWLWRVSNGKLGYPELFAHGVKIRPSSIFQELDPISKLQWCQNRLRECVLIHGHWLSVVNAGITQSMRKHGRDIVVMLDPPDNRDLRNECHAWAIENGNKYKIMLGGLIGQYEGMDDWNTFRWKSEWGRPKDKDKQVIYFSPLFGKPAVPHDIGMTLLELNKNSKYCV